MGVKDLTALYIYLQLDWMRSQLGNAGSRWPLQHAACGLPISARGSRRRRGGARDASATAARASRIRHPLEHCALAWPCRTYLGFPRQVRMAKLAERFANFGGPEKSGTPT